MEDKLLELMTKMYSEFTEFKKDMYEFKEDMHEFKRETKNDIIGLENKIDTNSEALFDGYKQTFEKLVSLERKVDDISKKVEKQDVEVTVIKASKTIEAI